MSFGNAPINTPANEIARLEKEKVCSEDTKYHEKEEISCIEEEKACIEAAVYRKTALVSRKWNAILPIFRLPTEILAVIFIHNARNYHCKCIYYSYFRRVPSWVNVSYVCVHWRNIALNCPPLWTYHFNVSLRWTQELLLRSKQAPLKISCFTPFHQEDCHWQKCIVDKLVKHLDRIQDLRLCLPPAWLPGKLSLRAPYLENLDIYLHEQPAGPLVIDIDVDAPVLRTLKLSWCPLPWYLLNLSRLSVLSLCNVPIQLDMAGFLGVLSGMPDVTVLNLVSALPHARGFLSSGGLGTSPKIDLPCLVFLSVTAPLSTVVALLSCVNIPLKACLYLVLPDELSPSINDYIPISSFLAQRFSLSEQQSSSGPIIRSVFIEADTIPSSVTFSSLERDCYPHDLEVDSDYDIPLKIDLGNHTLWQRDALTVHDRYRIIANICCSLPLTGVQTLHVTDIETPFSSTIWREILGHLHGLRYMRLSCGDMPDLSMLSIIAHVPVENGDGQANHDQDSTSNQILVPALEELVLSDIKFIPDGSNYTGFMSRKALSDVLSTRKGLQLDMFDAED